MTLEEMMRSNLDFLTPEQASDVLGCKPYSINVQAQADASKLGFPVCVIGTRVRIPREAFVRWVRFGNAPGLDEEQMALLGRTLAAAGMTGTTAAEG